MAEKSEFVKVAVEPQRKQQWEEAVAENHNVSSLSALVRFAVEREINGSPEQATGATEEIAERLGDILDENRKLNTRFESLESRLARIESQVSQNPEVQELAGEVFSALPDDEHYFPGGIPTSGPDAPKTDPSEWEDEIAFRGSVSDIARVLDEPKYLVQEAIDVLLRNNHRVQKREYPHGDEPRYVKEV